MLNYGISLYAFAPLLESGDISKKAAIRFSRSVGYQGFEMLDTFCDERTPRDEEAPCRSWLSLEFEGRENLFFAIARGYENLVQAVSRLPLRE